MKILLVTRDRPTAELGAQTLHAIAPNGTLAWAQSPATAVRWLEGNRDAATVILEAEPQDADGAQFLRQVHRLAVATRIVAVPPGCLRTWLSSRRAQAGSSAPAPSGQAEPRPPALPAQPPRPPEDDARHRASTLRTEKLTVALQERLFELERAIEEANRAKAAERDASAERLARREAELGGALSRANAALVAAEQKITEAIAAAEQVRQRAADELSAAAVREAAVQSRLAGETRARGLLEQKLATAEVGRADAERRHAVDLADALARLADLQTRYDGVLKAHASARVGLEQQFADADAARRQLVSRAAVTAARLATLEDRLVRETAARQAFEQNLAAAEAARANSNRRHATELAQAAAQLVELQKEHDAMRTQHVDALAALDRQLAEAAVAREELASDAAARLAELRAAYDAALAEHAATRATLDRQLADASAVTQDLLAREADTAVRQAALEDHLAREMAARAALEQNLAAAEAARADAERRHATELADAAARLAELHTRYDVVLADHATARVLIEQQLADADAANQRLMSEATVAAATQSMLEDRVARETASRERLERDLAAAVAARIDADRAYAAELAQAAGTLADLQKTYEAALADHAASCIAYDERLACAAAELDAAEQVRRTLETDLVETRADALRGRRRLMGLAIALRRRGREQRTELERHIDRVQATHDAERQDYERHRLASEVELDALKGEHDQARRALDHLGIQFATLERLAADNALERARLESALAERDASGRAQMERHAAAERTAAETIAALQKQLEDGQREIRRVFERAPYGLCRFMPDGAFIKANHSFARLLGYKKVDEIRKAGVETIFECPADLRWVIEQAVGTVATRTIATTLKTRSGRRVDVRLHALGHIDGTVDVGVQDITAVRALEARLREAQRMEAVGRVASEVAVTCDMVLRDATDDGRQWLAAIDSDPQLRRRGELLLGEVTRAASFLRQFSVYGHQQISAVGPVSVQRIVRDLAPVLKRVAGDDIEWILPKTTERVEVDVEAQLVERVLVNVASYARERMPHGGRIRVEVATTVLGRDVISKYPNVRSGAHALITIAEVKEDTDATNATGVVASGSDRTGVDLGALLTLLGNCGGHLWIAAERSGNMTLKVHLPQRVSDRADGPDRALARTPRTRQLAAWFRH